MNSGQIKLVGSLLNGFVGGKPILCTLFLGTSAPRGRYRLLRTANDPIYGPMITMVPVSQGESQLKYFPKVVPGQPQGIFPKTETLTGTRISEKQLKDFPKVVPGQPQGVFPKRETLSGTGVSYKQGPYRSFMKDKDFKSSSDKDFKSSSGSFMKIDDVKGSPSGASYILCRRFMPGWNNIVVTSGFSDLVEALRFGSITVTA